MRQVLDLRSTEERREAGDGPLAKAGVRHDYLVVIDGDDLERRRSARTNAVAVGQEPDDIMAEGYGELLRTDEAVQTLYALAIVAANQMLNAHDLLATSRRPVPADGVERLRTSLAATLDDAVELFARRDGPAPGPGETTG